MMRLSLTFPSTTLFRPVETAIALPHGFSTVKPPYRVLWALHCAMERGEFFFDTLGAAEVVDALQIAIVAPSLGNGCFIDSPFEAQGDFLQELLHSLRDILPLSRRREDNAVLGVSMGGFGAIRWALESGAFGSAAAISGIFDCTLPPDERMLKNRAQRALYLMFTKRMRQMLLDADGQVRPEADMERLLRQDPASARPRIHLYCGDQDYLSLPHTTALQELCARCRCPVTLRLEGGEHDAVYWRSVFQGAVSDLFDRPDKKA